MIVHALYVLVDVTLAAILVGARGPHGPEPPVRCVLWYPRGSSNVLLNSNRQSFVSSRVLLYPPVYGIQ